MLRLKAAPLSRQTRMSEHPGGTSTDLFVGLGSDFDRPGLLPRANYGIGIGHTFGFLKKDPELVREGIDVEVVRAGAPKLHPGSSASNLPSFLTVKNSSYSQRIAFWRGTAHEYEVF